MISKGSQFGSIFDFPCAHEVIILENVLDYCDFGIEDAVKAHENVVYVGNVLLQLAFYDLVFHLLVMHIFVSQNFYDLLFHELMGKFL